MPQVVERNQHPSSPLWSAGVGDLPDLVSRVEIAQLLGLSPQRVHVLVGKADFPPPVLVLAIGTIWKREDVVEWARRTGRLPEGDDRRCERDGGR